MITILLGRRNCRAAKLIRKLRLVNSGIDIMERCLLDFTGEDHTYERIIVRSDIATLKMQRSEIIKDLENM